MPVRRLPDRGRGRSCHRGPVIGDQPALERQAVGEIDLIPVAAPSHPLARADLAPRRQPPSPATGAHTIVSAR